MTVAPEMPIAVALRHGRDLVSPELFERLADFCAEEYGHERSTAERIMSEALAFLDGMGQTGEGMSPSTVVDPGWHTFMLHTEEYAEFCRKRYGRFIHHAPKSPIPGQGHDGGRRGQDSRPRLRGRRVPVGHQG
ncbi:hypothetical protein AB0L75_07310 [Streptomyces sp. NPDC052101]|uniref:hypothetical protein n=1 Tax=Streptomyces sp. NPDC052101 TaxID=3155763 RepID=UPI003436F69F